MNGNFSKAELEQYHRHLILSEFGIEKQQRLKSTSVLVVGAGGLGAPLLLYLAAAGIGTIGIIDFDSVDKSNLQRQVLYTQKDIGKEKAKVAKEKIIALNPHINVKVYIDKLSRDNALSIVNQYDIIADGTDNFASRYLVNDACVLNGKTNVYASIFKFEGQVAVFNYKDDQGNFSPNYRDLFPNPPEPDLIPNCAEAGVIGILPGIIGCLQANEVIKIAAQIGEPLIGKLMVFDALTLQSRILNIRKDKDNPLTGENKTITELIDYEIFCGNNQPNQNQNIKAISSKELKKLIDEKANFQLIDVRNNFEYATNNLNGLNIPLDELECNIDKILKEKKVIIHCKSGARSKKAILLLKEKYDFQNLFNLEGGLDNFENA